MGLLGRRWWRRALVVLMFDGAPSGMCCWCCRTAIRRGQSVKYLVNDAVIDYIAANSLYSTPASSSLNAVNNNIVTTATVENVNCEMTNK